MQKQKVDIKDKKSDYIVSLSFCSFHFSSHVFFISILSCNLFISFRIYVFSFLFGFFFPYSLFLRFIYSSYSFYYYFFFLIPYFFLPFLLFHLIGIGMSNFYWQLVLYLISATLDETDLSLRYNHNAT